MILKRSESRVVAITKFAKE